MVANRLQQAPFQTHRVHNVRAPRIISVRTGQQTRIHSTEPTVTVRFLAEGSQEVSIDLPSGEYQLRAAMLENKGRARQLLLLLLLTAAVAAAARLAL